MDYPDHATVRQKEVFDEDTAFSFRRKRPARGPSRSPSSNRHAVFLPNSIAIIYYQIIINNNNNNNNNNNKTINLYFSFRSVKINSKPFSGITDIIIKKSLKD
ncbi:hypothetical protein BGZ65_005056, partial [Modicella reniformis]